MPEEKIERARFCSQCGNPVVVADANFCKECGAPLAGTVWFSHDITWRPSRSFFLSVVPGLGHLYKGQGRRGVAWFICVMIAWAMNPALGLLLHAICALNAAFSGAIREEALRRASHGTGTSGLSATVKQRP